MSDLRVLLAQAGGSHVPTAASYAVFGGVLASAVVAGLMVQMAVRSNSPERNEYPAHPLGFALALLTTSVLLFTALTGRQPNAGAVVAFIVPACLLSAGGVLTFAGIAWLSMGTGGASDELVNWRILSRAATAVAAVLTWQTLGNARDIVAADPEWQTSGHALVWAILLAGPGLVSLHPGLTTVRARVGGQASGTVILRWAAVAYVIIAVALWVVTGERTQRVGDAMFLNLTELILAGGLGLMFGLIDVTLPVPPQRRHPPDEDREKAGGRRLLGNSVPAGTNRRD